MEFLELSWKLLVARGVIGIVFGLAAMVWPLSTALALVALWGVWALVDGIATIGSAVLVAGYAPARILSGLLGVLAVVAAVFAFTRPVGTAVTLTWLLGIWLMVRGVVEAVAVVLGRRQGPALLGLAAAALSVVAGVLFAANPGRAAVSLAWVLGLVALCWGVVFLVTGLLARRELANAPAADPVS